MIAVFDIAGPLVSYAAARSAGSSAVIALVLSGISPAIGVAVGVITRRRIDAIAILVLAGIAAGTGLGLAAHNARLVLIEGSVPTGVFGLICLASLAGRRPLMFHFAMEFMGKDTARGRDFAGLWRYPEFRHTFRVITAAWGLAYLVEAAARIIIVQHTSTGTALAVSKMLPFAFAAVLAAWTAAYSIVKKRQGERIAATVAGRTALGARNGRPPGA